MLKLFHSALCFVKGCSLNTVAVVEGFVVLYGRYWDTDMGMSKSNG